MKHALVTGGAGFIGSHLVDSLLQDGWAVTVADNLDPFYDPAVKEANLRQHASNERLRFLRVDLRRLGDASSIRNVDVIVHLAARAGVQQSIADPVGYQDVNVTGTQYMLEFARHTGVDQFVFASSSSVYGINPNVPWREDDPVLLPISPYASTKVSGELLGHVYSHLYGIRFIALRLFTVYGPRQRPDLAIHKFARCLLRGAPLPFYGDGLSRRDYTYVGDIVQGMRAAMEYHGSPYEVINLGNNAAVTLAQMVSGLEHALGISATLERLPLQPGDVPQTWASIEKAAHLLGYAPRTTFEDGVSRFAAWLRSQSLSPHHR